MVVKIVFHAEGGRGVNAGERGLSMLWSARNVVKMWQRISERQDEMRTREDENTLRNCCQKTRITLSFGCTLSITTKAVRMSTYSMEVVKSYNKPLDRQLMERVKISNFKGEVLMNRRTEMGGVRVERTQYRRWGGGN